MSSRDELTAEQRAALAEQLGDAQPARASLIMSLGKAALDRREHDHTTQREDWYCLNLAAYMGDRIAPVLRRLLDAEARAARYRIAWGRARTRARSQAGAADRYAARARAGQIALQDALVAIVSAQMERDAARSATLREVDERLAAMQLPEHLKGTLNAGSYADAWRRCRDIVQAMTAEMDQEKDTSDGSQPTAGESTPDASQPGSDPLVVSRYDVVIESAPEEDPVLTVGAIAEDGRPVALLFDPEARRRVAGWLAPGLTEGGA